MKKRDILTTLCLFMCISITLKTYASYRHVFGYSQDSLITMTINTDSTIYPTEEQEMVQTQHGDTVNISIANKEIEIIEKDGETQVKIKKNDEEDTDDNYFDEEIVIRDKEKKKFRGHWAGFSFGLNNYVDKDFSISRSPESDFLDLNTGRSWNFNLNFMQYSIGMQSNRLGLLTGMGMEWSNYHFSNNNSIMKENGEIVPRPVPDNMITNRLQTTYLTIPMILEFQFFDDGDGNSMYLSFGVVGGIKLFSHTKLVNVESGNRQSEKVRDDFYLSPARWGFTTRFGYKAINLFLNTYRTPLFISDRAPENLYPVAAGLAITF